MKLIDMLLMPLPLPLGDPRRRKHYGVGNVPNTNLVAEAQRLRRLVTQFKPAFPPNTEVTTAWIAGYLDISCGAVNKSLKCLVANKYVEEVEKHERREGCVTGKPPKYWIWIKNEPTVI